MLPQCLYSCGLEFLPLGLTEAKQDPKKKKKKFHGFSVQTWGEKLRGKRRKKAQGGEKGGKGMFPTWKEETKSILCLAQGFQKCLSMSWDLGGNEPSPREMWGFLSWFKSAPPWLLWVLKGPLEFSCGVQEKELKRFDFFFFSRRDSIPNSNSTDKDGN